MITMHDDTEFQDKRLPAGASALLKLEGNLALMLSCKLKQPETMKVNCWLCAEFIAKFMSIHRKSLAADS